MSRPVLVIRGGTLPRSSGLGRAHHDLLDRLKGGQVPDYHFDTAIEHDLDGGVLKRWLRRRKYHPRMVAKIAKDVSVHLFGIGRLRSENAILHITDQEQAHLVPKVSKIPVSVTVHDLFHLEPRKISTSQGIVSIGDSSPGLIRRRDLKHIRRGLERADLLICISEATAKAARKLWPKKEVAVVPHGIDVGGYDPISYPLPKPKGLDYTRINLLCVGSEEPRKRMEFLIDVLGALPEDVKMRTVLHKVGSESSQKSKQKLLKKAENSGVNLHWVGCLSDIDLCGYYQHCNALLFPSIAEGFGLPPLEAMASGCPVLVADMPAHNEVAPAEWLLPHEDIESWVNAIMKMGSNQRRRPPNETALKRAQEFSIEVWSERLKNAWNLL